MSQNGYLPSVRTEDCVRPGAIFRPYEREEWLAVALSSIRMDKRQHIWRYFLSTEPHLWYIWQS